MSIPIDKLYHYIESIAQEIYNANILIYHFYPHGSKKIEDLKALGEVDTIRQLTAVPIYCYDQEPLSYMLYQDVEFSHDKKFSNLYNSHALGDKSRNIKWFSTIYDRALLVHSEKRSSNLNLYSDTMFIPVYYWSHAIIALDWFRYAKHETLNKDIKKQFLIYNRAWSGTREYRLKFIDLLIQHDLISTCRTTINAVEPELGIHYTQHSYINKEWMPVCQLENYVPATSYFTSAASADYEIKDYNATEFEVVLETLFDDDRIQLTEKVLRPIALGQPFLLASTHGSLEYLRSYGFRTFASVIDETYDTIADPVLRLEAIVKSMKEISNWTESERSEKIALANQIAAYNRRHFFSSKFNSTVVDELKVNLKHGLDKLENTNTSSIFLSFRKKCSTISEIKQHILTAMPREHIVKVLTKARSYYKRTKH